MWCSQEPPAGIFEKSELEIEMRSVLVTGGAKGIGRAIVREMARDFADGRIRPMAEELDREERFPAELYAEMGELGLFGICVPEDMGGPGFDTVTLTLPMAPDSSKYARLKVEVSP